MRTLQGDFLRRLRGYLGGKVTEETFESFLLKNLQTCIDTGQRNEWKVWSHILAIFVHHDVGALSKKEVRNHLRMLERVWAEKGVSDA